MPVNVIGLATRVPAFDGAIPDYSYKRISGDQYPANYRS